MATRRGSGSGRRSSGTDNAGATIGKLVLYPLAVLGAAQIGWQGYQLYQGRDHAQPAGHREAHRSRAEEDTEVRPRRRSERSERTERAEASSNLNASEMPHDADAPAGEVSGEEKPRRRRHGATTPRQEEQVEADTPELLGPPDELDSSSPPRGNPVLAPKSTAPDGNAAPTGSPTIPTPTPSRTPGARSALPVPAAIPQEPGARRGKGKIGARVASAGSLGLPLTPGSPDIDLRHGTARAVPAVEVSRGITGRREVALTFDAGSDYRPSKKILDTLAAAGVKCTFFLTGEWVEKNPRTAKRIADEGHEIGNHSWNHPAFTALRTSEIQEQLDRTDEVIVETTGRSSRPYFRPPLGARDERVRKIVGDDGYLTIYWTLDSWDSVRKGITAEQIRDRVLGKVQPGSIVLMHCGSQATAEALPEILEGLKARNLTPVTVSGILTQ
jgi:peptidoglycan/xylan/chitin deacetylase (PgdA/CDA1 family)